MRSNVKIRMGSLLLLLLLLLFVSCVKRNFTKVKNNNISISDGFYTLDYNLVYENTNYKRYVLKKNGEIIIDGYWSLNNKDTISFIRYDSINKNCISKLLFFIPNSKESHYLGHACPDSLHFKRDVLVTYDKDTIINKIRYFRFHHSIIDDDDYNDNSNSIKYSREFLINLRYGVVLIKKEDDELTFSPYWFNY